MARLPISVAAIGGRPILLVDRSAELRSVLRGILRSNGIRTIFGVDRIEQLKEVAEAPEAVLVFSRVGDDRQGWDLAADTRAGRLPLPADVRLIAYAADPTIHMLRQALMVGVDEFLAVPLTGRAILAKLTATLERPKPFITTPDYTGPDNAALLANLLRAGARR